MQINAELTHRDLDEWLHEHGEYLFNFAVSRLRDNSLAQDVVQETFLAAFRKRHQYAGKSTPRNWLMGILKNKIYDHFRRRSREVSFTDLQFMVDEESARFLDGGRFHDHWIIEKGPRDWDCPESHLGRKEFWETFHGCAAKLPKKIANVFLLREMDGLRSSEICDMLNITDRNLWVMLHRARMALRQCLEDHWFSPPESTLS